MSNSKGDKEDKGSENQHLFSGYQVTYTGVLRVSRKSQQSSVDRLARPRALGTADANRVVARDVKDRAGVTHSYQWTAGGKDCHGFIW